MGPVWFIVQSLTFSRGGLLGVVPLMRTVTTATMMTMMMITVTTLREMETAMILSNGSTNLFRSPKWLSQFLLE